MRYLGLDLGTKTLGLAISNGMIATSLKTIHFNDLKEAIDVAAQIEAQRAQQRPRPAGGKRKCSPNE